MMAGDGAVIETERLCIYPFQDRFLTERYVGWLNDKDVMRYSEQRHRTHTMESCRTYVATFDGSPNLLWAICTKEKKPCHIGNASAYVDEVASVADVGILVGERWVWGQGYGSEAWTGICDYLLRVRGVQKITAGTRTANRSMLGVMRKAGMVPDDERNRECEEKEEFCYFLLQRSEWCSRFPNGPFGSGFRENGGCG